MRATEEIAVETAETSDEDRVVATITLAFSADPVVRWIYPDPLDYLTYFPQALTIYGEVGLSTKAVHYTEGFSGVALWNPPRTKVNEEALISLLETSLPPVKQQVFFSVMEQSEHYQPDQPFWYLPFIGVEPVHQRKGYGSLLMKPVLEICDREGLPAYLEATSSENIRLYRRHSFEVIGAMQEGAMPPLTPMVREPRPPFQIP